MTAPKRVEYAAAITALRERAGKTGRFEAAIAALEEHAALVALARAAQAVCDRRRGFAADEIDEALASGLVQRALKRDSEGAPRADGGRDDDEA